MATRARFKKLTDLYIKRKEVELPDGSIVHIRALNAFERDECLDGAQIARARVVMALKEAGQERLKVEARMLELGPEEIARELADVKTDDDFSKVINGIRDDPDWKERLEILERTDFDDPAHPPSDEEIALIAKINAEYLQEIEDRRRDEFELQCQLNNALTLEELQDDYLDAWLDKKARKVANEEYLVTEIFLAATYPDGERVFETKAEVRECPADLFDKFSLAISQLQMDTRDPKDSGSDQSSSASSPPPNAAEASGTSTSAETPTTPPGTSPQLSTTP